MSLAERLAGVELLTQPTWVFDAERGRIVWANKSAVELWRAESTEELLGRDFSNVSEATRTRHKSYFAAFQKGRTAEEVWTWYPRGQPLNVRCTFSGIALDDGRIAMLCEATIKQIDFDRAQLRGLEALRHTPALVALLAEDGQVLMQNPAALRAFGENELGTWFVDSGAAAALQREVAAGRAFRAELLVRTTTGQRWHELEALPTLDPATGKAAVLVHQFDVTDRRERKELLEAHRLIVELSAPILRVGEKTLAVPVIGALDAGRSDSLSQRLLARVVELRARTVILDLTGADVMDAASASRLSGLVRGIELLGARPILTGAQPALAKSLISADVELSEFPWFRTLHEGLEMSLVKKSAGARSTARSR